jgi:thiol-disulfide isomerase/thioredoxin
VGRDRGAISSGVIVGIIAVIVVVAGVVAIISSRSDDTAAPAATVPATAAGASTSAGSGTATSAATGTAAGAPGAALEETRPVTITGAALPVLPDSGNDPAVGSIAPVITGQSFDGTPVSIKPGKPTLVVFVAHWCPHCQREVPRLVAWDKAGQVPAGIDVIGVATATTTTRGNFPPSTWLAKEQFPWPVLADSAQQEASTAFGLNGFPFFALYDASGKIVLRQSGEVDTATLGKLITHALGT